METTLSKFKFVLFVSCNGRLLRKWWAFAQQIKAVYGLKFLRWELILQLNPHSQTQTLKQFSNFQDKKRETEELLGSSLAEERFALLVNLGKKINDFGSRGADDDEENIDETYGINVQFQGTISDKNRLWRSVLL